MKRYEVKFEYHDDFSFGDSWSKQSWVGYAEDENEAVSKCKKIYGLGIDPTCDYHILSVREVK